MSNWTKALLVALRIAIGWHFLYEGVWKIDSDARVDRRPAFLVHALQRHGRLARRLRAGRCAARPRQGGRLLRRRRPRAPGQGPLALGGAEGAPRGAARQGEARGRERRAAAAGQPIVGFDWLDLRDEVLKLPPEPAGTRFSSRPFLQASAGPFRPLFRALAGDIDGLERLTPASAQAALDRRYAEILRHYERAKTPFTSEQQETPGAVPRRAEGGDRGDARRAADRAADRGLQEDARACRGHVRRRRRLQPRTARGRSRKLDATADELVALVNEPVAELSAQAQSLATLEQLAAGPLPRPAEPGAWIDWRDPLGTHGDRPLPDPRPLHARRRDRGGAPARGLLPRLAALAEPARDRRGRALPLRRPQPDRADRGPGDRQHRHRPLARPRRARREVVAPAPGPGRRATDGTGRGGDACRARATGQPEGVSP